MQPEFSAGLSMPRGFVLRGGAPCAGASPTCSLLPRHCPDSRRTFTKRLMLEKHIQLMHGIKDPDLKEMTEATTEEDIEVKEDAEVKQGRCLVDREVGLW